MTRIPAGALIRNREVPELGPGRILAELEGGAAQVVFENSEDVREVRLEHADIVRQPLIPGTRVKVQRGEEVRQGEIAEVDYPDSPADLCAYIVDLDGSQTTVFESQVTPLMAATDSPLDQLGALHWRGPFRFFTRWDMHRTISRWYEDSEGLPTTIGARIEPMVHHVHAARQVLWDPTRRFVLADQDPQGRLYEAGLIYQRMAARAPQLRVLVVAPGRRTYRWQADLETRFGGRIFRRVDTRHLAANPSQRWAEVSQHQRVVVSTGAVQQYPEACTKLVVDQSWDLVVIDEAHLLDPQDPAYQCLKAVSGQAESVLTLAAMPARPDPEALAHLLGLAQPERSDPDDQAVFADRIDRRTDTWETLDEADSLWASFDDGDQPDDQQLQAVGDAFADQLGDDPYVVEQAAKLADGDASVLGELVGHVAQFYGIDRRVIHSRRAHLGRFGVSWLDRSAEVVGYEPDDGEQALIDHLAELGPASLTKPMQMALRAFYYQAAASSPERMLALLEQRLDALDTGAGQGGLNLAVFELLDVDLGPAEKAWFRDTIVARAGALDNEAAWVAQAMSLVAQWSAEPADGCARFEAAGRWIESTLDQSSPDDVLADDDSADSVAKVVVVCADDDSVSDVAAFLERRLAPETVTAVGAEMEFTRQNEIVERFRNRPECRVLVCAEVGAAGRDIAAASTILHLDQPWSSRRVARRIDRLDQPQRGRQGPVHSVVLVGPSPVEKSLHHLYHDILELYGPASGADEFELAAIDRRIWRAGCGGPAELGEAVEHIANTRSSAAQVEDPRDRYPGAPSDAQLVDDADFADLLDFIDGIADSLPIRHWARMLGVQDHSSGTGVYDFKWHWGHVRRALSGFETTPEDVEFLMPQQKVEMMAGTFSRKQALGDENLSFFAPGHRFIDALIEDASTSNDGRVSVFARRLGPQRRGQVFVNVVAATQLDRQAFEAVDMPDGLLNRAFRHLWPESVSVPVKIDLQGHREPAVVDDRELIQKLEESYQGPEADQKIEYEIFIQAIEHGGRFRQILAQAVDLALDKIRDDRAGLVDAAAAELADDLGGHIAYWRGRAANGDDPHAAEQLDLLERLIDSVRQETVELDALGVVVAGTPQVLVG